MKSFIEKTQKLLIMVAMESEETAIVSAINKPHDNISLQDNLNLHVREFKIKNRQIYVLQSGVGLVNAAAGLTLAKAKLEIDSVLVLGVAGSLQPNLNTGDTVVARSVQQHDAIFSGESGIEFMAPGELHLSLKPHERNTPEIETDIEFSTWIYQTLKNSDQRVYEGKLLSGSEFVGNSRRKNDLASLLPGSLAVDMEAAAIVPLAKKMALPCAVAKTIADRVNHDGTVAADYLQFLSSSSEKASLITQKICEAWDALDAHNK